MTDEEMNKAIAEVCGWKEVRVNGNAGIYEGFDNGAELRPDIPDYCADLNAMHEAEKTLKGYEQIHTYIWHLSNREDWETDFRLMEVHISARDRAEAFLRTLGKLEEVQR